MELSTLLKNRIRYEYFGRPVSYIVTGASFSRVLSLLTRRVSANVGAGAWDGGWRGRVAVRGAGLDVERFTGGEGEGRMGREGLLGARFEERGEEFSFGWRKLKVGVEGSTVGKVGWAKLVTEQILGF